MNACSSCGGNNPPRMRFCGHCGASLAGDAPPTASREAALRSFVSDKVATRLFEGHGLEGERRLVTALFADLSGFTGLADRLDPEELLQVIDPIISALTKIVGRYDGYVDKFAGDALLAFFGAPVAHDDDAIRALLVAEDMHREMQALGTGGGREDLTLHIGVNTGHVISRVIGCEVRRDYSVLGDAVILAQRLQSVARAGETLVGATTYELARNEFRFESVGELELKGKVEAVPGWRVLGRRTEAGTARERMIGRASELKEVEAILLRARAGAGRVITVSGGPGVGKSTFVNAVRKRAQEAGLRAITARALPYGTAVPFWPFMEAFRSLAEIRPEDPPERVSARLGRLSEMLPSEARVHLEALLGVGPVPDGISAETYLHQLKLHLCDALSLISRGQPLLLVLEDAHWFDQASRELLEALADRTGDESLVVIVTSREEASIPGAHHVALGPLDREELAGLARGLLGVDPTSRTVDLLLERSGGNPLFAEELVRVLKEKGLGDEQLRTLRAEVMLADERLPVTIEGVLSARIDTLSGRLARTLQVASVIGRRVRVALLEALLGGPAADDIEELSKRGFLDEPTADEPEVTFHHALIQEAAYERLLKRDRRKIHLEVARAAETLYGSGDDVVGLLARHMFIGGAGEEALPYLLRAGERSRSLFANDAAILHLERAASVLAEAGREEERTEVLLRLGALYAVTGDFERSLERFREAEATDDGLTALLGRVAAYRNLSRYRDAERLIEQGMERAGSEAASLLLERGWVQAKEGRLPEARATFEAALEIAQDDAVRAPICLRLSRMATSAGDLMRAVDLARAATTAYEAAGDLMNLTSALRALGIALMHAGAPDDAATHLRRALALAEKTGHREEVGGCLINLGLVELERGRLDDAIAADSRAVEEFRRIGHATGRAIAEGNLAEKLLEAGRLEEAAASCTSALDIARSIGDRETVADVFRTLARVRMRTNDPTGGLRAALQSAALYEEMGAPNEVSASMRVALQAATESGRVTVIGWIERELEVDLTDDEISGPSVSVR